MSPTDFHLQFLRSLGATVVVETAVLFLLLRGFLRIGPAAVGNRMIIAAGMIASTATIPYVWFIFPHFAPGYATYLLTAESFAVLAEIPILAIILKISVPKASLLSFVCNMASFGVGLAINRFL